MSKRGIYLVLSVAAGAAVVAAVIFFLNNRPLPVRVAKLERNVQVQVFGLGTIEAQVASSIGFEVGAALVELTADHGSLVKSGDTLARLESSEQEARVARAKAGVNSTEAALARAAAMVDRQAAVLAQKQLVNQRQQELLKKNATSVEKAEEAAKDVEVAEADLALSMADAAVARAAIEASRADLAYESTILAHHVLKAPFDAIVVNRQTELGTVVKAGDPVYTVVDPASVWVLAHVEESRAGAIALGQNAEVSLRSLPGSIFQGHVARIGIESDRVSEERRIWVKCGKCPVNFHLGEQAEVIVTTAILPEALLVPENAVSGYDGRKGTVWTIENGVARELEVAFGHRTLDGRLEVTGGLPKTAEVVSGPIKGLSDGRAAQVSAEAAP